jgi:hypothetical protein
MRLPASSSFLLAVAWIAACAKPVVEAPADAERATSVGFQPMTVPVRVPEHGGILFAAAVREETCPPNSHEQDDACYCDDTFIVNEARDACIHECEADDACAAGNICSEFRCKAPPCTEGSCGEGNVCIETICVADLGNVPIGVQQSCADIPSFECEGTDAFCGAIVPFEPDRGDGWWDYNINGETQDDQYRSYARRDLMALVKYATAQTRCLTAEWPFGNGGPLGLGDMTEVDGAIPGTSIGQPGHPAGTHVNGRDMDIAYYQAGTADNTLRPICGHTINGREQYHCTETPSSLDVWRTALFIAKLHDSPQVRVIGVDGKVGPIIVQAIDKLCAAGLVQGNACEDLALAYEPEDQGRGWFMHHHHHLHVSLTPRRTGTSFAEPFSKSLVPGQRPFAYEESNVDGVDPRAALYKDAQRLGPAR